MGYTKISASKITRYTVYIRQIPRAHVITITYVPYSETILARKNFGEFGKTNATFTNILPSQIADSLKYHIRTNFRGM